MNGWGRGRAKGPVMMHCRRDGKGLHILVFLLVFLWSLDEMHG